jgi:hypothetical protein
MALYVYEMLKAEDPQLAGILSQGHKLNLKIEESVVYFNEKQVRFDDLINRSDYFPLSRFIFHSYDILNPDPKISLIKSCFNAYTWTNLSSLKITELACIIQGNYPLHIILYPETKSFLDAFWLISVPSRELLTCNLEPDWVVAPTYEPNHGFERKIYSPRPVVHGPQTMQPDSTIELEFEYRNWRGQFTACDFDTRIKYNAGYLPKNIVQVKDGRAKVKVTALSLEPGDEITCKFSIGKVYTNSVQHTIKVI